MLIGFSISALVYRNRGGYELAGKCESGCFVKQKGLQAVFLTDGPHRVLFRQRKLIRSNWAMMTRRNMQKG